MLSLSISLYVNLLRFYGKINMKTCLYFDPVQLASLSRLTFLALLNLVPNFSPLGIAIAIMLSTITTQIQPSTCIENFSGRGCSCIAGSTDGGCSGG